MSKKKMILTAAILTSLTGCASVTKPSVPEPVAPSSVKKGCPSIPYIDGKAYAKLENGHKRVYKDALTNNIRCRQNRDWIVRLKDAWPK